MLGPVQCNLILPAPEVVLEIPSDTESSRRPSHCSVTKSDCSPSVSTSLLRFKQSSLQLDIPRPCRITRRASHGGEQLSPSQASLGCLLDVPRPRERICSLPDSSIQPDELYMLRSFSVEGRKVVNRGDSIRSRRGSRTSMSSRGSRYAFWVLIKSS